MDRLISYDSFNEYILVIQRFLRLIEEGKPLNINVDISLRNFKSHGLIMACQYKFSIEVVEKFLNCGANVNALDDNGSSALMHACSRLTPDTGIIRLLIYRGADINIRDHDGCSPYMAFSVLNHHDKRILDLLSGAADRAATVIQRAMHDWLWAPYTKDGKIGLMPARMMREIQELK
jgi:ankyrin repeat protein